MGKRVLVANHKGGSGKTSTIVNLAAGLAEIGRRVLVVDMDPQANASRRLAARYDPENPIITTAEIVKSGESGVAAQGIRPCGWDAPYSDRIDVISARFDLDNRVSEAGTVGAVHRLATAMEGVDDEYDITLLDTPPSLGHLTQLALAAADVALGTLDPEYDGVEGAIRFKDFIADPRTLKAVGRPDLRIIGWIVDRYDRRLGSHVYQADGLAEIFGAGLTWEPMIPERAASKDAAEAAVPLALLGTPQGREQASRYSALAQRLIKEIAA